MKRIVFLIIGIFFVLGAVLPGCEIDGDGWWMIYIAVCGPFTDIQGMNMWDGATMAIDEINAAGRVTINGTPFELVLKKVETRETTEGEKGSTGQAHLAAVIDYVDFFVGGFRTEVVDVYREVAMNAKKIFMDCGAATGSLQFTTVTNYARYKYWFKSTPYNESFLVTSLLKMTSTIGSLLKETLQTLEAANSTCVKDEFKVSNAVGGKLRVEILMENAAWCAGMVTAANNYLPLLGFNVTGSTTVSPTALDISDVLATIALHNPHIIFTAFSGQLGQLYSIQKNFLPIPAMTIGINVPGQQLSHWANTDGMCEGEIMLDAWAVNLSNTPTTLDWFNDYTMMFGQYPIYTVGTYDAIKYLCEAIEATQSLDSDTLVAWMEQPANMMKDSIASARVGTYPMPDITYNSTLCFLTPDQVAQYYDLASYNWTYNQLDWGCGYNGTTQQPHIAHDLLYGPGYATGIGSQWQAVNASGQKVGIWPMYLGPDYDAALTDQYGNWNFQYPGTKKTILPIGGMLNIPWDPYAHLVP